MSIFLDENSRIIVQGITGGEGREHATRMLASGAKVVGGTNPRKAGETVTLNGTELPVFGTVSEAMEQTAANVSVIFVPAAFAKDAMIEAIDAQIPLAVVVTEGIPVKDTSEAGHTPGKWAGPGSSDRTAPASSPPRFPWPASPRQISPDQVPSD